MMWNLFATATGGAAAGLTGLVFIVVSFRYDTIATSTEYRNRAAQTITLFLTVTVAAALVTVPQYLEALGVEILVVAVASGLVLLRLDAAARIERPDPPALDLTIGLSLFVTGLAVAGVVVFVGQRWGMYAYAVSALTGLVWGVYGAWNYLTRAGTQDSAATG